MKLFKRMYFSIIVVCIILGASSMASNTKPPSDRCILIKVQAVDGDDVATLSNMGLDIWEHRDGSLIIRVTNEERSQIIESSFTVETVTENVYEYTEKISKKQISPLAEPTTAKYHSYAEVIDELIALEDSGVARTYIIGSTHEGRDIWAVKISDNPSDAEDEPGAVFLGCHHAREWISVEVPLYIAQYLANNYQTDAEVKNLVDNCEIWIVPVVNPDGYEYSRTVDRMWRKNRRDNGDGTFGVDLNRNYSYMWGGPDASPSTSSITYRGPSAFSEPETQAVRDLVLANDFRVLMSYHNYGQQICYPWAYTWDPCPDYIPMSSMYHKMRNLINETSGAIYTGWTQQNGYLIGGDTGDWSYGELGIYSFLIELPPMSGFVLPESRILPTCLENLPVALYLISLSAENGGIQNLTTGTTYGSIQFAINEASEGDEILINPGIYQENILFKSKNLTLRSLDPNDPDIVGSTVIEGVQQYPVITMSSNRDTRDGVCIIDGLTITDGGPGISCLDVSPIIRNCLIEGDGPNAIEFSEGYEPIIVDCTYLRPDQVVPALVAYWTLDEAEGVAAHDSFFDNYAYIIGDPVWLPADGKAGGALQLDGIDDYLSTPFILNPAKSSLSAFAWINGGSPGQVILSQTGDYGGTWLGIDPSKGALMTGFSEMYFGALVSETVITDGQWHHVGLVYDMASLHRRLYVDGALVAEDATVVSGIPSDGGMYIGTGKNLEAGTFFSGLIDDVCIYTRALNTEEVENLPAALYLISSAIDSGEIESPATGRVKNLTAGKTYNNIRFAITDASQGDEIVLSEGIYEENINFKGKNLIFRSKNPNDPSVVAATVIKGSGQGSVVTFSGGEDASCVLAGFTITGGNAENGGGIYCGNKSAPKITNCVITKNSANMGGGGIYIEGGSIGRVSLRPELINCTIINNSASVGGGLYTQLSNTILTNCTLSGNSAVYFGGGICVSSGNPSLTNCILWGDIPDEITLFSDIPIVTYSDVQGGFVGEGNIDADPLFADAANGDYHLNSQAGRWDSINQNWLIDDITSPCVDAGDPSTPLGLEPMPNGGIINMGAYGGTVEASMTP